MEEVYPTVDVVVPATMSATATSSRVIAPPLPPVGTLTTSTSQDPTSSAPCTAIRLKGERRCYHRRKRKKQHDVVAVAEITINSPQQAGALADSLETNEEVVVASNDASFAAVVADVSTVAIAWNRGSVPGCIGPPWAP
ncbi:unnamed protein product [Linum trigynum]